MAVNSSRSQRIALMEGTTDGKYYKVRPDTEVVPDHGAPETAHEREHLHPTWNYGFPNKQIPGDQRATNY